MSTLTELPPIASVDESTANRSLPRPAEVLKWLSEMSVANRQMGDSERVTAPCLCLTDEITFGSLYICSSGNTLALAFHGPRPFILRWYNWASNTGVIGPHAQLNWYLGKPVEGDNETVSLAYVCPPTEAHILHGLALQFRWEIIRDREVEPLEDRWDDETEAPVLVLNDALIDRLAADRARAFLTNHVRVNSLILARPRDVGHVYDMAPAGRAESSWGLGAED